MTVPASLRERKKAKTRAAIREHALRLFEEQGYASTTVDQIAEAAEVSPSTFFRYFPTKEDVVITDDYDPLLVQAVRNQPPEVAPVEAVMNGMRAVFDKLGDEDWAIERRRQHLFNTVPELRQRAMQQTVTALDMLADVIAERRGEPSGDLVSRVIAGAMIGVVLAVMPPGRADMYSTPDYDRLEAAFALLRDNLTLS